MIIMAFIHCENTLCKHYYEDSCMNEMCDNKMTCIGKEGMCETFESGVYIDYLRVYKMNDYEWWVTHMALDKFYQWYLDEYGLEPNDNPLDDVIEFDINNEGMWYLFYDDENIARLEKELNGHDSSCKGGMGDIERKSEGIAEMITFRKAIELSGGYTGPYCIACTE